MKKHVLVLCHSASIGGAELALASLIESTKKTYHWTMVFTDTKKAPDILTQNADNIAYLDLPWWCHEANDSPRKVSKKSLLRNLGRLEQCAKKADILLTNTITIPWLGFLAHKLKKPHVWYVHEFGDIDHNLQFILGYDESLRVIDACSNRILTISSAVKEHLEKIIETSKIDLIHQSIDLSKVMYIPANELSESKPIKLLCMGALKPSKGQHVALAAVSDMNDSDITLDIVGPSADQAYVEKLLNESKKSKNIRVQPRPYDIREELSTHDIVLMCSENEALGRVTLESLAAGRFVIGYACTATSELLSNNRGITYTPNTPEALASVIRNIHALSKKIDTETNRKFVSDVFSPRQQADDFKRCVSIATESTRKDKGQSLEMYIAALDNIHLFLSTTGSVKKGVKKVVGKVLPEPAKKYIRRALR